MPLSMMLAYMLQREIASAQMDIVVGTPLRMAKLAKRERGVFSGVEFVVLDEADKLLGDAFLKQVDAIIAACTHPRKARGLSACC